MRVLPGCLVFDIDRGKSRGLLGLLEYSHLAAVSGSSTSWRCDFEAIPRLRLQSWKTISWQGLRRKNIRCDEEDMMEGCKGRELVARNKMDAYDSLQKERVVRNCINEV